MLNPPGRSANIGSRPPTAGSRPPTADGEVEQQILGGLVKVVSKSIDLGKNLYVDLDFTLLLPSLTTAASILKDQQLPLALHPCPPFGVFPLILFLLFRQHPVELQKFFASERSIVDKHFFPTEDGGFGNDSVGLMCQFYPALGVMAVVEHFQFWHKCPHSRASVVIVGVVGISGLNDCHKVHDLIQGYGSDDLSVVSFVLLLGQHRVHLPGSPFGSGPSFFIPHFLHVVLFIPQHHLLYFIKNSPDACLLVLYLGRQSRVAQLVQFFVAPADKIMEVGRQPIQVLMDGYG